MTGHDNGLITVALVEADDAERERRLTQMGEPYRALLGHFRHEVGQCFWDVLVRDGSRLEACRNVCGDGSLTAVIDLQPYNAKAKMQDIIDSWLPLTFAMNSLNRLVGHPDLYPFVLSPTVVGKLAFVHDVVHGRGGDASR